jgi:hypothetical protein
LEEISPIDLERGEKKTYNENFKAFTQVKEAFALPMNVYTLFYIYVRMASDFTLQ